MLLHVPQAAIWWSRFVSIRPVFHGPACSFARVLYLCTANPFRLPCPPFQAVELAQELADTLCLPCAAEPSAMATATAPAKGGPRTRPQTQFLRLRGTKRALLRHGPPNHRSETLHLSTQQTPSPETSVVSFKSFDTEEESRESTDRLHLSASAAALKDLPASAIYCTTDTFLSATAPALPDPRKLRELLMDAEGKSDRKKEQQRR